MKEYYDRRASEYDEWYLGTGLFAERERPEWEEELERVVTTIQALPAGRTLDVACGTGFLTMHLAGDVIGLDQSSRMLEVAHRQAPTARFVSGDALALPFPNDTFSRIFTGHFYGHLESAERERFLAESRRVARELVIVDSSRERRGIDEEMASRTLNDGSTWQVYKRYFRGTDLVAELGGGEVLHEGRWFVVVRSPFWPTGRSPR